MYTEIIIKVHFHFICLLQDKIQSEIQFVINENCQKKNDFQIICFAGTKKIDLGQTRYQNVVKNSVLNIPTTE